jgi:NADPH:quinone reductase-like Zn-dependent oxidoreductase
MKAIVQHEYGAPQDVLHLAEWRCRPSVRRTCWCRCVYGFGHGAFAEYVAVPQGSLAPKPGNLSFEQAAAVPLAAVTALQGLRAGGLQPGQQVLIAGASGGVGTFAVQIAGHLGAQVTGVCSTRNVD